MHYKKEGHYEIENSLCFACNWNYGGGTPARGDVVDFSFDGSGVSGSGTITYTSEAGGTDTITGITGLFSDTNAGINGKPNIVDATITGIIPINPVVPLPAAVIAPDFSQFTVVNGIPSPPASQASPSLSYDNNFYPDGSPIVCTDYPFSGGVFDVYGVLFTISNGDVVGLWSNGITPGPVDPAIYGVAVADANNTYDYVGGVTVVAPEPAGYSLMALVLAGMGMARRRKAAHGA